MNLIIQIQNNKTIFPEIIKDGKYKINIVPILLTTSRSCQEQYFTILDLLRDYSGYSRYELHEMYKQERNVTTTKNMTIEEWIPYLDELKFWCFNNFEIVI